VSTSEIVISIVILAAVAVAAWLGRSQGQANPIGTGKLQSDVSDLRARMGKMESSLNRMRNDLDTAPTKADIKELEGHIETVGAIAEKTDQAVVRIEQLLMQSALPVSGRARR